MSQVSTTALYINQDQDRQSIIAFDFDDEVVNSKSYKRAMADKVRHASIAAFRAPSADSLNVPGGLDEDNLESVTEGGTDPYTLAVNDARDTPNQAPQLPGNTENLGLRLDNPKHVRSTSKERVDDQQWRLYDRQPAATKNFSRPDRSTQSSSTSPTIISHLSHLHRLYPYLTHPPHRV